MKNLNNRNNYKTFIVYVWSHTGILIGEEPYEMQGGYIILEESIDALNEHDAEMRVSSKYNINIDELIAKQIAM